MGPGFSTQLLDDVLERERVEREGRRIQLIKKVFAAIAILAQEIPFEEAYLFGSIVKTQRFSKGSDVDIGFVGLGDEDFFKAMSFISREIGVEVDVIQLEGHRLEAKVKREGLKWTRKV